jgi:CDP-diglyceride synthetase
MWVIIILFVCILSAVFGDLLFSLFKRKNDIKDFSSFLLGHGGILDRFDSYIIEIAVINFILLMIAVTSTLMNIDSVNRIFNVAALPIH